MSSSTSNTSAPTRQVQTGGPNSGNVGSVPFDLF